MATKWRNLRAVVMFITLTTLATLVLSYWIEQQDFAKKDVPFNPPATINELRSTVATQDPALEANYRKLIAKKDKELEACFSKLPEDFKTKSTTGNLTVNWVVDGAGKAIDIQVRENTLNSEAVKVCIEELLREIDFSPRPEKLVVMQYDFRWQKVKAQ